MLISTEHEILTALNNYRHLFLPKEPSDVAFIMLINVKMPTIVGILIFMSKINFMFR